MDAICLLVDRWLEYLQTAVDKLLCGEVWKGRALWSRPPVRDMGPVCWADQLWKRAFCSETSVDRSDLYHCFWGWWMTCQSPSAEVQAPDLQPWRNSHSLTLKIQERCVGNQIKGSQKAYVGVVRASVIPWDGIVSSEQQGVFVCVLYPLEHWIESLLDLWLSKSRPLDKAKANSSWGSIWPAWSSDTTTNHL